MVMPLMMVEVVRIGFVAEEAAEPVLERLEPPHRAAVLMALLGIMLAGLLLVVIALLGGNWVRRMARHRPRRLSAATQLVARNGDRSLRESRAGVVPNAKSDETLHVERGSGETKADRDG